MEQKKLSRISALALNSIFGFEPKFSHSLIDSLGSAEAVFLISDRERLELFGPYTKYLARINDSALDAAEKEYDRLTGEGYQILSIYDEEYPEVLRDCPDAPMALYVRSTQPASAVFNREFGIAVVGTRDISPYGREWCRRIVDAVSQAPKKPVIVSGMALGVDITAHMQALESGLATIGVLPVGIDDVYPRRHWGAAQKIAESPGSALVTDYPPGSTPSAVNFIRRNRIIAGMSAATVLIESKTKGGGMITARLASSYGREVFALPGRIDDIRSQGCNQLIREKTAEPVTDLATLPGQLGLGVFNLRKKTDVAAAIRGRFSEIFDEKDLERLVTIGLSIKKVRGASFDDLCRLNGMDYSDISRCAGILESEGIISVDLLQRCCINTNFQ